MDKAAFEAMLHDLERRHSELMDEAHRVEGKYSLVLDITNKWPEEAEAQPEGVAQEGELVDATTEPQE